MCPIPTKKTHNIKPLVKSTLRFTSPACSFYILCMRNRPRNVKYLTQDNTVYFL